MFLAPAAHAADITLLAGGATKDVIEQLIPAFEKATSRKVVATWDGAPAIRKRLGAGESYDLVISSAPEIHDAFIQQGKLAAGSRNCGLMQTGVGVAVRAGAPKPDISSADALKRALLAAKTIGHSAGTSGAYVVALMPRLGIAEETKPEAAPDAGRRAGRRHAGERRGRDRPAAGERTQERARHLLSRPAPPELQHVTLYAARPRHSRQSSPTPPRPWSRRSPASPTRPPSSASTGCEPG